MLPAAYTMKIGCGSLLLWLMSCMPPSYETYEQNQANSVAIRGPICALIWAGGAEILREIKC